MKMFNMHFYWWRENGMIIVQNAVMGMMGQKHSHTEKGFKQWSKDILPANLHKINSESE